MFIKILILSCNIVFFTNDAVLINFKIDVEVNQIHQSFEYTK